MHVDGQTVCMMLNMPSKQVPCRPPELIDDVSAPPSPSADIWSLAAVLLQCLTGRPPYEGMRSMQMRRALLQRHAPGPVPEDLPSSLKRLLQQCFHEMPDQRPSLSQIKQVCKQHGPVSCNCMYAEEASGRYMGSFKIIALWTWYLTHTAIFAPPIRVQSCLLLQLLQLLHPCYLGAHKVLLLSYSALLHFPLAPLFAPPWSAQSTMLQTPP